MTEGYILKLRLERRDSEDDDSDDGGKSDITQAMWGLHRLGVCVRVLAWAERFQEGYKRNATFFAAIVGLFLCPAVTK